MRSDILLFRKALVLAALALSALPSAPRAAMILVYGESPAPVPLEAKLAAASLLERWHASEPVPENDSLPDGFRYQISKDPALTNEYSVGPGVSAYFLCDDGCKVDGLGILGQVAFEARDSETAASGGVTNVALAPSLAGLKRAAFVRGSLELTYALTQPGTVYAEILGLKGQVMRRWAWKETAGEHFRSLRLSGLQGNAPLFLRWRAGDRGTSQAILPGP